MIFWLPVAQRWHLVPTQEEDSFPQGTWTYIEPNSNMYMYMYVYLTGSILARFRNLFHSECLGPQKGVSEVGSRTFWLKKVFDAGSRTTLERYEWKRCLTRGPERPFRCCFASSLGSGGGIIYKANYKGRISDDQFHMFMYTYIYPRILNIKYGQLFSKLWYVDSQGKY